MPIRHRSWIVAVSLAATSIGLAGCSHRRASSAATAMTPAVVMPAAENWQYWHSPNVNDVVSFINLRHPRADGVRAAIVGQDLHVWVRNNDVSGDQWTLRTQPWQMDNANGDSMAQALGAQPGRYIVLGVRDNQLLYLEAMQR